MQLSRETLFHNFHDDRRIADLRFGDEQVEVFAHHDVPVDYESVLAARLLQDFQKSVAAIGEIQNRLTPIAAAGDEVKMLGTIVAMESAGHTTRVEGNLRTDCDGALSQFVTKTHTSQSARCVGHPAIVKYFT